MYATSSAFDRLPDEFRDDRHRGQNHHRSNGVRERSGNVRLAMKEDYRDYGERGGGGPSRQPPPQRTRQDHHRQQNGHARSYRVEEERSGRGSREGSGSGSVREVSDHLEQIDLMERGPTQKRPPGGTKFMRSVQNELEDVRQEWKSEVDRLTEQSLIQTLPKDGQSHVQGTNSVVDTSSGTPIFTAYVDVSEFHPDSVEVEYDHITNKVIVKGRTMNGIGTMTKTFTQKVQLPRFSDDQRLTTKLSRAGILKVEVPLMYYFPQQQHKGRDVKSFINEVKTNRDGSQTLEILVNTGPGVRAKDLHVQVTEDRELLVTANKDDEQGRSVRKLIKRYHLSERADTDRIKSRLGKDGRLIVLVPLFPKH